MFVQTTCFRAAEWRDIKNQMLVGNDLGIIGACWGILLYAGVLAVWGEIYYQSATHCCCVRESRSVIMINIQGVPNWVGSF